MGTKVTGTIVPGRWYQTFLAFATFATHQSNKRLHFFIMNRPCIMQTIVTCYRQTLLIVQLVLYLRSQKVCFVVFNILYNSNFFLLQNGHTPETVIYKYQMLLDRFIECPVGFIPQVSKDVYAVFNILQNAFL